MANDNVVGRVMILLKLPDEGIRRTQLPGESLPNILKGDVEIINEIIQQGVSTTDWASDGIHSSRAGTSTLYLDYEG